MTARFRVTGTGLTFLTPITHFIRLAPRGEYLVEIFIIPTFKHLFRRSDIKAADTADILIGIFVENRRFEGVVKDLAGVKI